MLGFTREVKSKPLPEEEIFRQIIGRNGKKIGRVGIKKFLSLEDIQPEKTFQSEIYMREHTLPLTLVNVTNYSKVFGLDLEHDVPTHSLLIYSPHFKRAQNTMAYIHLARYYSRDDIGSERPNQRPLDDDYTYHESHLVDDIFLRLKVEAFKNSLIMVVGKDDNKYNLAISRIPPTGDLTPIDHVMNPSYDIFNTKKLEKILKTFEAIEKKEFIKLNTKKVNNKNNFMDRARRFVIMPWEID